MSRPREKRETREQDLFRSRLDQIINMKHELVRLAQAIDWPVLMIVSARFIRTDRACRRWRRG